MALLKKLVVGGFLLVALIGCSWALLRTGMFRVHDFTHAARIAELLRAAQDGQFPVRWTSNFGFGYGMPLFEFYAPLPFYVGAFFYWLGVGLVPVIKLLFFICSLATFVGMYKLASRLFGTAGGIVSAFAITLAPYRAVNLFVRGSLSEAWGIMALPWVLLGIVRLIRGERRGWLTLTFGLLMLFLSHNITTLLFLPMSIIFAIGYWCVEYLRQQKPKFPWALILTYALAIGLAAFYLFPAFLEKDFTKVNGIFEGYFHYSNHFLYIRQFFTPYWGYGGSVPGPEDGLSFFLGFGHLFGLAATLVLFFKFLWQKKQAISWQLALLGLLVGEMLLAAYMSLAKSTWIWDRLSFMVAVQFPWRWLSVLIVFLALILGAATLFISKRKYRYLYSFILMMLILFTTTGYFRPESFADVSQAFYYGDPERIRHDMSRTLNDYIPEEMLLIPLSKEIPPIDVPYQVISGDAKNVSLLVNHVQEKLLQTQFPQTARIEFAVADFPGWVVLLDGQVIPTTRAELGNIMVDVPAGNHLLGVQFRDTPIRSISDTVSVLSWLILVGILIWQEKQKATKAIL